MLPSRIRRCSSDLDELIKIKQREWEMDGDKISETEVTSLFANELKKNNIFNKKRKDLL